MSQKSAYSKTRIACALYLIGFALLYLLFLFFEVRKGQYINANSLEISMNADQYRYLLRISRITTTLEYMMSSIFFIFLIVALFPKRRSILTFIRIQYILILVLFLLGYLFSISFSTPVGNNTQALVLPFSVTTLVLFLYMASTIKKRLIPNPHDTGLQ